MLINFPYIKRDSPVHRLDPRTKLILLFLFIFVITQSSNFWFVLAGLIVALFYYRQTYLTWLETRSAWIFVTTVTLTLVIMNYLITGGNVLVGVDVTTPHVLFTLPFISFTGHPPFIGPGVLLFSVESITFVITQFMRNIAIGLFILPITFTIDPAEMGVAFRGMGLSDKFAYAIDLSIRFLPSIGRDISTTFDAQRARGFELEKLRGGIFSKIRRLAPMIVPVVIGSVVDMEDVISAMELRCFGVDKRSWLVELHPRQIDRVLLTLGIITFVVVTILNILGNFTTVEALHFLHTQGIPRFLTP